MKKRVVCYGCGGYGQYIMDQIVNCWTDEFELLGTADRACDEMNHQIACHRFKFNYKWMESRFAKIYSIAEIKELYDSHVIDGTIIALRKPADIEEVSRIMEKLHITVFSFNDFWNYLPASHVAEEEYEICDRYKVWVVKDCRGRVNLNLSVLLLYDEKGNILKESFNHYDRRIKMDDVVCPFSPTYRSAEEIVIDKCCVLTRCWSHANYGHFMQECMDKLYVMEESKFDGSYMLFDSEFARSFIQILGLDEQRIIWVNPRDSHNFFIKELHCVESIYGMTAESAWALKGMTDNIIARMRVGLETYPKRVYVKRIGRRKLLGAEYLLEKYQFQTIVPEELTLEEQIKYFYAADVVLSPHGANSTNCLYMRKGTHFVETFGQKYINAFWSKNLALKGVHYHMVVGFGQGSRNPFVEDHSDYTVDLGLLELILQDVCKTGCYSLPL